MRALITLMLALVTTGAHAAQPDCIPATWALSTTPVGTPVARHTDRPTLFMASNHGLAAYWYCQSPTGAITYWEVHGTPKAILEAGGASVLEMLYLKDRDASLGRLSATPCKRGEIADPEERQLCKELLDEVKAHWPGPGLNASR